MNDPVLLARSCDIATLTLNRPERLNALDLACWRALAAALEAAARTEELRCLVLRGAGGKAFAAGADLAEFQRERASPAAAEAYGAVMNRALAALRDCPVPTVALIEGVCAGAGLEIAILCDLRIAGSGSRFGVPIQKVGVVMPFPEIAYLVELVGHAVAREILLEGRMFDAAEAKEKGLLTRVVADEAVEREALAAARRIADGAPLSHRYHKKLIRRSLDPRPLTAEDLAEGFAVCASQDYAEGIRAFLGKRRPVFTGR
jgi:enoyl-CoA hydratase/carnithine racemase